MTRPLLLDLFCCAGGASRGYWDAGFDVVGVDIEPQPHYPYTFIRGDALQVMGRLVNRYSINSYTLSDFDAFAASPPCQKFSRLSNSQPGTKEKYPDLIPKTRELLGFTGKPYAIENVPGAPLRTTVTLCGTSFGKQLQLHRDFETNFPVPPLECDHTKYVINPANVEGRARIRAQYPGETIEGVWRREKGVEWMNGHEGREAIIPAFTEYIGGFMLRAAQPRRLELRAAA